MFDQSLCISDNCEEKLNCIRYLIEEKYCFNPVKLHLGTYQCTSKNNYHFKVRSSCDIPTLKGGEIEDGIS